MQGSIYLTRLKRMFIGYPCKISPKISTISMRIDLSYCSDTSNSLSVLDNFTGWMSVITRDPFYLICDTQSMLDKVTYPIFLTNVLCIYLLIVQLFLKLVIFLLCLNIPFYLLLKVFSLTARLVRFCRTS